MRQGTHERGLKQSIDWHLIGVYLALVLTANKLSRTYTDSSMFRANEACEGKGQLTVEDGKMTLHITLVSKNIVNLFLGVTEDAQKDDAELIEPTTDTVTYKDGTSDDVYGFDVPVEALDQDFDLALIGTKGKWYDHTVSVSNPEEMNDDNKLPVEVAENEEAETDTEDAE